MPSVAEVLNRQNVLLTTEVRDAEEHIEEVRIAEELEIPRIAQVHDNILAVDPLDEAARGDIVINDTVSMAQDIVRATGVVPRRLFRDLNNTVPTQVNVMQIDEPITEQQLRERIASKRRMLALQKGLEDQKSKKSGKRTVYDRKCQR